jgi:hypothetical protein
VLDADKAEHRSSANPDNSTQNGKVKQAKPFDNSPLSFFFVPDGASFSRASDGLKPYFTAAQSTAFQPASGLLGMPTKVLTVGFAAVMTPINSISSGS